MNTAHEDTIKAFGELVGNPQGVARGVARIQKNCALVGILEMERVKRGISQRELAKRAGLPPSTVNRMEAGTDAQLTIGHLKAYLRGLGLQMSFLFDNPSLPAAGRIRLMVGQIGRLLDHLQKLALQDASDDKLIEGIRTFRAEVLLNFVLNYAKSDIPELGILGADDTATASPARPAAAKRRQRAPVFA